MRASAGAEGEARSGGADFGTTSAKATALGARYRRILRHRGHRKAVVAIGRHILEISYHLLTTGQTYEALGADYFDRRYAERLR